MNTPPENTPSLADLAATISALTEYLKLIHDPSGASWEVVHEIESAARLVAGKIIKILAE